MFFPGMGKYEILSVLLLHIDYVLNSCENSLLLSAIIFCINSSFYIFEFSCALLLSIAMPFPSYFPLVLTLFAANHFTDIHALREVSGVLNVHHSLNLTRMHYHMRFWKEELSSLPPSLAELPRLMLEHKRGELAMLTRTLLKESRLDPAVFPSIQDQTPIKVQYASLFFVIIFPACPSLSPHFKLQASDFIACHV